MPRRPPNQAPFDAEGAGERKVPENAPIVPIYLREMGSTPLLTKAQEIELARELERSRAALLLLSKKLPAEARQYVLPTGVVLPRRSSEWMLEQIEAFYGRLVRCSQESEDPHLAQLARQATRHKNRLDHARDGLILANLRLVIHIAKRYVNHGVPLMDLVQEGNIGLMKAVERFRHERGFKFSTYAYWWIKQAIDRAIADKARVIRLPVHVKEKLAKIARASNELGERLGRKPTPQEIADKLRMAVDKVEEVLGVVQDPLALEEVDTSEEGPGLLAFLADTRSRSPLGTALDRERRRVIAATLASLDPRSAEVLRLRFGIGHAKPHSLEEIGRLLSLSRERIRQIESMALRRIQRAREARRLREILA